MSQWAELWQRARRVLGAIRRDPRQVARLVQRARQLASQRGLLNGLAGALRPPEPAASGGSYEDWVDRFDTLCAADIRMIEAHIAAMQARPLISVLVPLYNTPEPFLRACIESVRAQMYPHWELCLADDASPQAHVRQVCEAYAESDARIRFVSRPTNGHIAAATNSALELAHGTFCALLDHDDALSPHALYMIAAELDQHPRTDMLFSDEDKIDMAGKRYAPWFKSDWNHDLMLSQNAVVHLAAYRTSILRDMGAFRSGFDGSQDYDVSLRFSERTTPDRIRHIPFILYHWRAIDGSVALGESEKLYPYEAGRRAIEDHLHRLGQEATVTRQSHPGYYQVTWPIVGPVPKVSIVLLADPPNGRFLHNAVASILERTQYPDFELVVTLCRTPESEIREALGRLAADHRVRLLYGPPLDSAGETCNWAAAQSQGAMLLFAAADIEPMQGDWLRELVSQGRRPSTGAVGAKLVHPNGSLVHAGAVVGDSGHVYYPHAGQPGDTTGYFGRAACTQQYSAIGGGCLLVRRELFDRIGGFVPSPDGALPDEVDLGLRLRAAGYANVWTPHATLTRHAAWPGAAPASTSPAPGATGQGDPFYNPNLALGQDTLFGLSFPPRSERPWRKHSSL